MKHLGDITKINGSEVPPVDVIIGGSPCQDLSVAGKRAGLAGERSGLFMEQIRIIKEMRSADEQRNGTAHVRPRYMVWENVPGAFSSNKGQDFRAVLEETARIVEKNLPDLPIPSEGWHYSGMLVGEGWSVAWRIFDAQFWGVPQRRRRIALVADFGGYTAPEILFERKSVRGYTSPRETPWKDFAAALAKRFGGADKARESSELAYCIQGNCIDRADTAGCNGRGWTEGVSYTLNTVDRPAVCDIGLLDDQGGSIMYADDNATVAPTIRAQTHGHAPCVYDARGNGDGNIVHTITGDHENRVTDYTGIVCMSARQQSMGTDNDVAYSLLSTDHKEPQVIALDRAAFNQGINAQFDIKISENGINSCLTSRGPSAVVTGSDEPTYLFEPGACSRVGGHIWNGETAPSLRAQAGDNQPAIAQGSAVRRLTPLECERLQGFPDGWTDIGDYIDTNGKKRKTSDTARYKALGNSIALPSWVWVLERLSSYCGDKPTMASLFDGIGGFPLIWETLNGAGACLWASEIEEFPIAVTKLRFGED